MKNLKLLSTTIIAISLAGSAYALPTGGQVVSGSASIGSANNYMTIKQLSPTVVINWKDFSSQPGETINFNQKSTDLAVNKVTGNQVSYLLGNLNRRRQCYYS